MKFDNFILRYYDQIVSGEITVGQWIECVYKFLVDGLDRGDFKFDAKKAGKAIIFIENFCHHCEGRSDLITLELWQKAMLSSIFGIIDDEGLRIFREVFIVIARKNGKTLLAAAIICYMAYMDGEYGAKVFCQGPKLDQAKLVFDAFYQMATHDAELDSLIDKRRSDLYIEDTNTSIKPIAFNSKTSDGFNPHLVINDEVAAWRGYKGIQQYDVMKSALGARRQPLIVSISTAGYEDQGEYDDLMIRAISMLKGDSHERRFLPFLYMIDDIEKWSDLTELRKSNPNMGVSVKESFYVDEIEIAKGSKTKKREFLTKYCNIKQNSAEAWLDFDTVNKSSVDGDIMEFNGCYAVGGFDLSQTTDLTAASVIIERDGCLYLFAKFFMPEKKIPELMERENIPYDLYVSQGLVKPSGENRVNYRDVADWFIELREKYGIYILKIGYDRYSAQYLVDDLSNYGFQLDDVWQGENLMPIMNDFEGSIKDGSVKIVNNNLLKSHMLNVAVKINTETRRFRPIKRNQMLHIDGFVATICAMTMRSKYNDELGDILENESTEGEDN